MIVETETTYFEMNESWEVEEAFQRIAYKLKIKGINMYTIPESNMHFNIRPRCICLYITMPTTQNLS